MSAADIHAQIGQCRQMLERAEQEARLEAWDALPQIHQSYLEAFDRLRGLLGDGSRLDDGVRVQLAELERRQRRLMYEFRKSQAIIKARLEDLQVARQQLGRISMRLSPMSGLDQHA